MEYKNDFASFLLESGSFKTGDFTLKSGRKSPFFLNLGDLCEGSQLLRLAEAYADAIYEFYGEDRMTRDRPFNILFGPAYKGIPIAVAVTMQLEVKYNYAVRYCADRKEIKDHGDAGAWLGAKFENGDRILMIEDVTTSGKSMEETIPPIKEFAKNKGLDVKIVGLVVSVDRMEYGKDDEAHTALSAISKQYQIPAWSIVNIRDIAKVLKAEGKLTAQLKDSINAYYRQYAPIKEREGDII